MARKRGAGSTGPRTVKGKTKVARNALKHGLRAVKLTLPGLENETEWAGFRQKTLVALKPEGFLEITLAERVAAQAWRLRRSLQFESIGTMRRQEAAADTAVIFGKPGPSPAEQKACALPDERNLCLIGRYETALERSLFRCLHELCALQAARKGQNNRPPDESDEDGNEE